MILRKPYAFFIKYFRLIHIILSLMVGFLLYRTGFIINFFNDYLNSTSSVVGQEIVGTLFSELMIIIPITIIVLSGIILGIVFKKEKPYLFYLVNIFIFITILVLTYYSRSFVTSMENTVMNIKAVKLTHDLLVISILLESFSFVVLLTRGLGLNFKKFDFSSDLIKINIDEKDREEIEININVDVNEKRRTNKKNIRYFKYFYTENKFIINILIIIFVTVLAFVLYYKLYVFKDYYKEGIMINTNGVNIGINQTYLLSETEDFYLIAAEFKTNSTLNNKILLNNDLLISIENYKILSTKKYCYDYTDLGVCYNGEILSTDFNNFLIFYEIPKILYESDIMFEYITLNDNVKIKLNPIKLSDEENLQIYKLNENLIFKEKTLNNINFKINNFEIADKFSINYNYCYKKDDCINSIEYIKPTINSNFDKTILKLYLEYNSENKTYNSFYKLFEDYGFITYKIDGKEYTQRLEFEELKGSKKTEKNIVYIAVTKDILNANYISLDFNIRNNKYRYLLKGE